MNLNQRKILHEWFSTARFVYNKTLEHIKQHKNTNFQSLRNQLVLEKSCFTYCSICYERNKKEKKEKFKYKDDLYIYQQNKCCGTSLKIRKLTNFRIQKWQINTPKEVRAHAVKDVVKAYKTCFSMKKPFHIKFKSKKRKTDSIGIQKQSISFKNGQLKIYSKSLKTIQLGKRSIKRFKEINHDCRLSYDGHYFYLIVPYKKPIKFLYQKDTIALDPGVRIFQTGYSEDNVIQINRNELIKKLKKKLDILSSKRRYKYKRYKQQRKITNVVDDLHWKTINFLTKKYKHILLPEFDSQDMMGKNKYVNRDVNILKHYKFKCRLKERINEIQDLCVYIVNESFTSKTCSQCGTINFNLGSNKVFQCLSKDCNLVIDRDINASRNIFIKHCS